MNFKNYFPAIRLRYQGRDERLTTKLITKKELKLCPYVEANQLNYVQECIMSKNWHGILDAKWNRVPKTATTS